MSEEITNATNAFDPNKIAADVTTSLITEAVKSGWEKVKKFFKDSEAKDSIDYGDAYADYLRNTLEKNSQIKTLIYRHVPQKLYSFYEYAYVHYRDRTIDTSNIQSLLNISNKLIVTGIGGIGKSLLLKHFFLNAVQNSNYIPVLIELRKFNSVDFNTISLYDAIYQSLSDNGFKLDKEYYSYSLNEGGYLILLDGFDEVNREKVSKVFQQIESFSSQYNKNHFVISSRPSDALMGWNDFHEVSLCNLTKKQALHLIQKIYFDEVVKSAFYKSLDKELFDKYRSFASNPLLLTIMLLTFDSHATIPEKLNDFYEQAFLTLFNMHDATKDCFVRDTHSKLGYEDFKTVFAHICICSYFMGDYEFSEAELRKYIQNAKKKIDSQSFSVDDFKDDLTLSVCMLVKDGLNYRFIHRSFQEYFAAWYTCKIPDTDQYDLLTDWISKSSACITDEYMRVLFGLQKDKVNKVILCPGIKRLKFLYDKSGFSYDMLYELFSGIKIARAYFDKIFPQNAEDLSTSNSYYSVSLSVKDRYLCNIAQLVCRLNSYPFPQSNEIDSEAQETLKRIKNSKKGSLSLEWTFEEALSIVSPEQLMHCLRWFELHLFFCFDIYKRYSRDSVEEERSISSILATL